MNPSTIQARVVVDELIRGGVRDVVLCPGSRNAPLAERAETATAEEDGRMTRGTLRIYLGAAPGVGKTYTMLQEAQRLRAQGLDVLVGVVETHGRSETAALLDGLRSLGG